MFSDPEKTIAQLGIQPGFHVADIGSGSGSYTIAAARAVGPDGRVYAIDVQQDLLGRLSNEAKRQNLQNIETIWGDVERAGGTKLADGAVGVVIVGNILFQIEDKNSFAHEMQRILKRGGDLLLVDWGESYGMMGPHPEHVVTQEAAEALFTSVGFEKVRDIDAGSHHYGIIFKRI